MVNDKRLDIRLTNDEHARLKKLAIYYHRNMTSQIKAFIENEYWNMQYEKRSMEGKISEILED